MNEDKKNLSPHHPPEKISFSLDGSTPDASYIWWKTRINSNKLLTDYLNFIGGEFSPPPNEIKALTRWVEETALSSARAIKAHPEEYNLGNVDPVFVAHLLTKYAEALQYWHRHEKKSESKNAQIELGRIEAFEEMLQELNVSDYGFILEAFAHAEGFDTALMVKRRHEADDEFKDSDTDTTL